MSELSLVIDKADSIEEEKEGEDNTMEKIKEKDDKVLEDSLKDDQKEERRMSSCYDTATSASINDKEKIVKIDRKSSINVSEKEQTTLLEKEKKKSFECESELKTTSDDVDENAQIKHVETQQDENKAQEIEMKTEEKIFESKDDIHEMRHKEIFTPHSHSISQDEDFEMAGLLPGCVAPAPTPAPSIAPLAMEEIDANEDDVDNFDTKSNEEKKRKRKEKKDREVSTDDATQQQQQQQPSSSSTTATDSADNKPKHNAVCPWEDE